MNGQCNYSMSANKTWYYDSCWPKKLLSIKYLLTFILLLIFIVVPVTSWAQLADSPWPMFGHDPQHTGQTPYLGPETSNVKWTVNLPEGGGVEGSPVIGNDGTIYVASHDFYLYAFQPNGKLKWLFPTLGGIRGTPAIDSDGTVYIGSSDGCLYAVDVNGYLKRCYLIGPSQSSPSIGKDGTVYIANYDGTIFAVDPNGPIKWKYRTWESITVASPAIGIDGTIYIGTYGGKLFAINPDGTLKWKRSSLGGIRSTAAISSDGVIYIGDRDGILYAINPDSTLRWAFSTYDDIRSSPVVAEDGTIYVGSWDRYLYAINPDGTLKWKYKTDGSVEASPAIASDGTIYVASLGGGINALNSDGSLKWSLTKGVYYGSLAIGYNNNLYLSVDSLLVAIGPNSAPPPNNPQKPEIEVSTNQSYYKIGDTLTMTVKLTNQTSLNYKVELKTWIRQPDGINIPVNQEPIMTLSPNETIIQEVYSHTFDGTEIQGIYMIGGRILKPATGDYIDQSFVNVGFVP